MKVKDLIAKLDKLDPEAHVVKQYVSENEYYYYNEQLLRPLNSIEIKNAYVLCENMEKIPLDFVEQKPKYGPGTISKVVILNF